MTSQFNSGDVPVRRRVGFGLGLGLLLLPFLFCWWLLRPGYSTLARGVGFGWAALTIVLSVMNHNLPASPSVASSAGSSRPMTAQAEFDRVHAHFTDSILPCEKGWARMEASMQTRDEQTALAYISIALDDCKIAAAELNKVHFDPPMPRPARKTLNADLDACARDYGARAATLKQMAAVFSGDRRPGAQRKMLSMISQSQARTIRCQKTYVADARAAGVELPGDRLEKRKAASAG